MTISLVYDGAFFGVGFAVGGCAGDAGFAFALRLWGDALDFNLVMERYQDVLAFKLMA